MQFIGNCQPGVPVDPGPRIPAAIRLLGVVRLHRNYVFAAVLQMRAEIVGEADVPVGPLAEVLAVDPHLAELINAVELDGDPAAVVGLRYVEALPVPADARGQIAALPSCGRVLAHGPLDAEVMRQVHVLPTGVRESRLRGALRVALEELPAEVKGIPDAAPASAARGGCRRLGCRCRRRRLRVRLARGAHRRHDAGRPHRTPQQTTPTYR